jgi:3-oxoacyl-[acyl-carrier-protein] synthase III
MGLGYAIASGRASRIDMAAKSGVSVAKIAEIVECAEIPVLGQEKLWELGVRAAHEALAAARVGPDELDTVIVAGSGIWDSPWWSPAAKIALEIGATKAFCYETTNFCNSGLVSLRNASNDIAMGNSSCALVVVLDATSRLIDYRDADLKALFNVGDAAAAMVVGPGGGLALRAARFRTDPTWVDSYRGVVSSSDITVRQFAPTPGLGDAYVTSFVSLVSAACADHGIAPADLSWFLINQGDRNVHVQVLDRLGIDSGKSVFQYELFGHLGGADTLIALKNLVDKQSLSRGDTAILASSAMGFSWGVGLLEVVS